MWTLAGLGVLGVVATALSIERVTSDAHDRNEQTVGLAAERVSSNLLIAMSSLRGADVLAADGAVSQLEFTAFATDIVSGSEFTALAFAEPVAEVERAAWEAEVGSAIVDSDGQGGFVPSPARGSHVAVRFVAPETQASRSVRGLDFMGDPVRAQAVREALGAPEPVIVGPAQLASSRGIGLFVINAIRAADGDVVGYVAAGVSVESVLSSGLGVADIERLGLSIDGTTIDETDGSASAEFQIGGRELTVAGRTSIKPNWLLPAMIGSGTVVLWAGAWMTNRRQRRERDRQRWLSRRNARLADLAEQLAVATNSTSVVATAVAVAGNVIGADRTAIGRRDPTDSSKMIVVNDELPTSSLAGVQHEVHGLHDAPPLSACVERATAIVLPDRAAFASAYPEAAASMELSGIHAQVCTPLSLGSEESAGAIGFSFQAAIAADRLDDVVATAQSVAQLVGRALERARVREIVQGGIDLLGDLSRLLAAARSRDDIALAVADVVPQLVGVEAAKITTARDHENGPAVRTYALRPGGDVELQLVTGQRSVWNATYESLTRGIVDLVDGAWRRAELHDHERSVLQRLQVTLLSEPPEVRGFEIAVAYRSAIEAVGIGGDWYSVIDDGTVLHAVIGDIAGHGPGAVALMAEVKTIMRYLLSTGSSISEAAERASAALERRNAFASAVLISIDHRSGQLTYFNAGHPPPLMIASGRVAVLDQVHRPWLGVAHPVARPTVVDFPVGATVLLYTDGLIEERGEHFDTSLARLRADVQEAAGPHELTQRLIHERAVRRTPRSVDDDVALIAIRKQASEEALTIGSTSGSSSAPCG